MYDFDRIIDRSGTSCIKWDVKAMFGAVPDADFTPMWIADMDFAVLPQVQDALLERVKHPVFGYNLPTPGCLPALCSWYERRHGWKFEPDQVINGACVVTMLWFAIEAITEPGAKIMVFSPVYDPFYTVIRKSGRIVVDVPMEVSGGQYQMDMDRVEEEMKKGVSAIIFCNPHNPVGKVWTKEELAKLAELCDQYNVYMLSDEVHGDIVMEGFHYTPMGTFKKLAPRLIVFTAISKTFNLAGLIQSAVIVPDPDLRAKVADALRSAWIMGTNAMAFPAMEAAYTYGDAWVDELNAYLTENLRYIRNRFEKDMPKISLLRHEGTYLLWVDMRCFGKSSSELVTLLGSYGVGLSSGKSYGEQCDGFMRLNFACPKATLEKGIHEIEKCYKDRMV